MKLAALVEPNLPEVTQRSWVPAMITVVPPGVFTHSGSNEIAYAERYQRSGSLRRPISRTEIMQILCRLKESRESLSACGTLSLVR